MVRMKRLAVVSVMVLGGCAHRAQITGVGSDPDARVDSATFSRLADDVALEVEVAVENGQQVLLRTVIPCRVGAVPPPKNFRMVYVTDNPTTLSPVTITQGFITVHRCEANVVEFSGGWDVEGTIAASLELPFEPPNPPLPFTHVELTHVTATLAPSKEDVR